MHISGSLTLALINKDSLLILVLTFQDRGVSPVALGRLEILLVLTCTLAARRGLLLNYDIALRFQLLAELASSLILEDLLSLLLMNLVTIVAV